MPTIVEVAKCARVSIATVSNGIRRTKRVSPALQERVQAAIQEMDYYPNEIACSPKVKQTHFFVVLFYYPETSCISLEQMQHRFGID